MKSIKDLIPQKFKGIFSKWREIILVVGSLSSLGIGVFGVIEFKVLIIDQVVYLGMRNDMDPWISIGFEIERLFLIILAVILIVLLFSSFFIVRKLKRYNFTLVIPVLSFIVIFILLGSFEYYINKGSKEFDMELKRNIEELDYAVNNIDQYCEEYKSCPETLEDLSFPELLPLYVTINNREIEVFYEKKDEDTYTLMFAPGWYYYKYYSDQGEWQMLD